MENIEASIKSTSEECAELSAQVTEVRQDVLAFVCVSRRVVDPDQVL